ncbi:hypothetical protein F2Q68_00020181 [Brassica cretica]|uniref:ABC transporter domain-containing protein n=1 Tax=Brassica cretica TaxID=69181 RepID=A0A8S9FX02_BRACR|nr:hypothetical protein F2Q68_00020181 [Brassica cretica]
MTGKVLDEIKGDIELKDVYFRYPARPDVQIFAGFSLVVPNGTTVALVGQSGSGKSTVISLIERFYDPESGEVLIDGIALKKLQENIVYGKEDASDEEIRTAVKLANATRFVDKLPQGLDTMVGDHGTQLSGGQKQRLAIARAILKNPKILLLDEATSALDAESERTVQDALVKLMSTRTTIAVAHRLTTIKTASMIAVVQQGKIIEKGTHEEMITDPEGAYSQLVSLQEVSKKGGVEELELRENISVSHNQTDFGLPRPINLNQTKETHENKSSTQGRSWAKPNETLALGLQIYQKKNFSWNFLETAYSPLNLGAGPASTENKASKKREKVSLRRLAHLNKPEIPVLLAGSLAAAVHGIVYPVHGIVYPVQGLLMSSTIKIFFEPSDQLRKDSHFWAIIFVLLGLTDLIVVPFQNYLFAIAGGRLIKRIRSLSFDKVIHQEISWFDNTENSR